MTEKLTSTALLDAAEAEFATEGIEGVSLRSIMRAAGANAAAVHYHFGSREKLAVAVVNRVLEPLQQRRLDLLEAAIAGVKPPSVDELVDALVRPDFEALILAQDRDPRSARIIGTLYSRPPAYVLDAVEASFGPVAAKFMPHLLAALPGLGADELGWRVRWNLFGMLGALLSSDRAEEIIDETADVEIARVVAAAAGALSASSTEEINQ